jgi:hypothetical protein
LVPESSGNYVCLFCDYKTSRLSQYERHISTDKHKNKSDETKMKQEPSEKFQCPCGSIFGSRSSLWRHKKICSSQNAGEFNKDQLIMTLIKQNAELMKEQTSIRQIMIEQQNKLLEQQNIVLEIAKNGTHNTNSNNKSFNLQIFLNETCKDAMNITDFVDSIKLQLSDLERVGELGYIEGISNIITTNLNALDITQRPIHCADKKREVLYVKDENKWEKEDEDKKKYEKP